MYVSSAAVHVPLVQDMSGTSWVMVASTACVVHGRTCGTVEPGGVHVMHGHQDSVCDHAHVLISMLMCNINTVWRAHAQL